MGVYLEPPVTVEKAAWLVENAGATEVPEPSNFVVIGTHVTICVIENGPFDAAAVVFDERELRDFSREDGRSKTWLIMETEVAKPLAPMWDIYIKETK